MKVAVIQLKSQSNYSKNMSIALGCVKEAINRKAKLVALPEVFTFRGSIAKLDGGILSLAEDIPGCSTNPFICLAKKYQVSILCGTVYENIKNNEKVYNTSVFISNEGKIIGKYRKINLFNANIGQKRIEESKRFLAGNKSVMVRFNGFNMGLSVCYDVRFPELYQKYSKKGADILSIPSAFTKKTGEAHWEVLLRSRAIENLCYVLAPNQIGKNSMGVQDYGHSMIIDPWGKVLAQSVSNREDIIYANIQRSRLDECRAMLPKITNNSIKTR